MLVVQAQGRDLPEGAEVVLGKKLEWEWGDRHATAEGRVKVEGVGDKVRRGAGPTARAGRVLRSHGLLEAQVQDPKP